MIRATWLNANIGANVVCAAAGFAYSLSSTWLNVAVAALLICTAKDKS